VIDWPVALLGALGFLAGGIGRSAQPGDRLRDIPRVFRRKPWPIIVGAIAFGVTVGVARSLLT
jgi:hypothetical protein